MSNTITCNSSGMLETMLLAKTALNIITISVPILLVVMGMIDTLTIMTSDDPSSKKLSKKLIPKILAATVVFLLPAIVNFIMNIAGGIKLADNYCWQEATKENVELKKEEEKNVLSLREKNRLEDLSNQLDESLEDAKNRDRQTLEDEHHSTNDSSDSSSEPSGPPITGTYEIKDKKNLVAIMYTTWFDAIISTTTPRLTSDPNAEVGKYQFWGEPALGFYKSSDKSVIKKHMQQLANAGIDFIILDNTNVKTSWKQNNDWSMYITNPMTALLDTIVEMRKNGQKTPYVVNWINTGNFSFNGWSEVNAIYDQFYKNNKYKDVWVYWNSKPFIITTSVPSSNPSRSITTRSMWGLIGNNYSAANYSYLERNNERLGKYNGNVEQVGVSVAMQANYMSNTSSATGRRNGLTFYEQWKVAFKYHPKMVTITWWNEWAAIQLQPGLYTDNYNQEYSRDIEPMKGGHGDTYYQWMKKYITAYKNNQDCPKLTK